MKNLVNITGIVLFAVLFTNCKKASEKSNVQNTDQIKGEIEKILKVQDDAYAQHDENKMQSTCADSLMYVNDGGITVSGYFYSHDMGSGWIERPHEKRFQFYNNTVFVSSIQKAYMMFGADTVFDDWRVTKVFIKENKRWKMAGVSYSPLQINYSKPGFADSRLYPQYTGVYKVGSFPADTILFLNGNLYESQTGARNMIFPLNDSTFMSQDDLGKIIFRKNSKGKVTHYIYVFYNGQIIHVSKIE